MRIVPLGDRARTAARRLLAAVLLVTALLGFSLAMVPAARAAETRDLVIALYSVPKEAYEQRVIPAFKRHWKQQTGQDLRIRTSYGASGAQARALIGGFEADVAALSVEGDLDQVAKAGLITHDWRRQPDGGMVTTSVVAFGVRKGNPKGVKTWEDLTRPGTDVLYPNPKTSGGAMWDIIGIYAAGLTLADRKQGTPEESAASLVKRIQKNVKVMDKSGRESVTTFERGVGDVIVTYENELLPRITSGRPIELVLPPATILIESPAAVVDRYADKHKVRDVAEAFVAFLHGEEAQKAFAEYHFRPASLAKGGTVSAAGTGTRVVTIAELGGWDTVAARLFGPQGVWVRAVEDLARGK